MDFDAFCLSRDMLYLSGAFMGLAVGCILSVFRKDIRWRSRNRRIALVMFFLSGSVVTISIAISVSLGLIFKEPGILMITLVCFVVFVLAARFPVFAAYPLFILSGVFIVWMGYSFLRFPAGQTDPVPLAIIHRGNENQFFIDVFHHSINNAGVRNEMEQYEALRIDGSQFPLDFSVIAIDFDRRYPIIGGSFHSIISEISHSSEIFFSDDSLKRPPSRLGIGFKTISANISVAAVSVGMYQSIVFDGTFLSFITIH